MTAKTLVGALGALSIGLAVMTPAPASAGDAGAFAAGIIGGTALGVVAGSALAAPRPYPAPRYYAAPVDYAPAADCWFERRPVLDPYGYVVGYRRTRVCE